MKLLRQRFNSMGCPCEIGIYHNDVTAAQRAIASARSEVRRLDRKYSHFKPDSYVSSLQVTAKQPGGVDVDAETAALLDYSAAQFKLSGGLFDITAGRLTRIWHQRSSLPSPMVLEEALGSTGWQKLSWRSPNLSIPNGIQLDLGGVVKEYAADRAAMMLKRAGMNSAFVELGGDIHVTGPHPDRRPWDMGIRKPLGRHQNSRQAFASITMSKGGLATSGDYERVSMINGKSYGHIIDPKSGWPVESFSSVSVRAPSCLLAGSLSTMAMLSGTQKGLDMLNDSGLPWLVQHPDGTSLGH